MKACVYTELYKFSTVINILSRTYCFEHSLAKCELGSSLFQFANAYQSNNLSCLILIKPCITSFNNSRRHFLYISKFYEIMRHFRGKNMKYIIIVLRCAPQFKNLYIGNSDGIFNHDQPCFHYLINSIQIYYLCYSVL